MALRYILHGFNSKSALITQKIARALQKEEQRHSVEAKTCQHDLAQQCQRQLQKRLSSRTSDDGETEPWEEATYGYYNNANV